MNDGRDDGCLALDQRKEVFAGGRSSWLLPRRLEGLRYLIVEVSSVCDDDDSCRRDLHGDSFRQHHHCQALPGTLRVPHDATWAPTFRALFLHPLEQGFNRRYLLIASDLLFRPVE